MRDTLAVINELEAEGIIRKYAIGGAIGVLFYAEPTFTEDLDIFCYLPQREGSLLVSLGPVYDYLHKRGYETRAEHIEIEGVLVQFLEPATDLVKEALDNAVERDFDGVRTRVFQYEHLLAIMAETGRPKDKTRINEALESAEPDSEKLNETLKRHDLLDRWTKIVT